MEDSDSPAGAGAADGYAGAAGADQGDESASADGNGGRGGENGRGGGHGRSGLSIDQTVLLSLSLSISLSLSLSLTHRVSRAWIGARCFTPRGAKAVVASELVRGWKRVVRGALLRAAQRHL